MKMSSTTHHLKLMYRFEGISDKLGVISSFGDKNTEINPKMTVWTSLPPVGDAEHLPHAPGMNRVALVEAPFLTSDVTKNPWIRVDFPYNANQDNHMPINSKVMFMVMTKVKNDANVWCYELTAAAQVSLVDLIVKDNAISKSRAATVQPNMTSRASVKGALTKFANHAKAINESIELSADIYSWYMPNIKNASQKMLKTERSKGKIYVKLAGSSANQGLHKRIRWAKPTKYEAAGILNTQIASAITGLAISKTLAVINPEVMYANSTINKAYNESTMRNPFPALYKKDMAVHAPYSVRAEDPDKPLWGNHYTSMVPLVANSLVVGRDAGAMDRLDDYMNELVHQSMKYHNMSTKRLIAASKSTIFKDGTDTKVPFQEARKVGVVLASVGRMAKSGTYVRDTVVLSGASHRMPTVENFSEVGMRTDDDRDLGGVKSWFVDPLGRLGAKYRTSTTQIAFQGPKAQTAEITADCEDDSRDIAVHQQVIREVLKNSKYPVIQALHKVAQSYRIGIALTSVKHGSINLTKAKAAAGKMPEGPMKLNNLLRKLRPIGAHMFPYLITERMLRQNVNKTLLARGMGDLAKSGGLVVDFGTNIKGPHANAHVASSEHPMLPFLVMEGTGKVYPELDPKSSYALTDKEEMQLAQQSVIEQEAYVRLRTMFSSHQIGTKQQQNITDYLTKFGLTTVHTEQSLFYNPNTPVMGDQFYETVDEMYIVPTMAQAIASRKRTKFRPGYLNLNQVYMTQIGERITGKYGNKKWTIPAPLTDGVNLADIIRNHDFVGILPTPEPHPIELRLAESLEKHMAPAVPLELPPVAMQIKYEASARDYPKLFRQISGLPSANSVMRKDATNHFETHAYIAAISRTSESVIRALAKNMADNPYVIGATLSIERATYKLVGLRLDATVDVTGGGMKNVPELLIRMKQANTKEIMADEKKEIMRLATAPPPSHRVTVPVANPQPFGTNHEIRRGLIGAKDHDEHLNVVLKAAESGWAPEAYGWLRNLSRQVRMDPVDERKAVLLEEQNRNLLLQTLTIPSHSTVKLDEKDVQELKDLKARLENNSWNQGNLRRRITLKGDPKRFGQPATRPVFENLMLKSANQMTKIMQLNINRHLLQTSTNRIAAAEGRRVSVAEQNAIDLIVTDTMNAYIATQGLSVTWSANIQPLFNRSVPQNQWSIFVPVNSNVQPYAYLNTLMRSWYQVVVLASISLLNYIKSSVRKVITRDPVTQTETVTLTKHHLEVNQKETMMLQTTAKVQTFFRLLVSFFHPKDIQDAASDIDELWLLYVDAFRYYSFMVVFENNTVKSKMKVVDLAQQLGRLLDNVFIQ